MRHCSVLLIVKTFVCLLEFHVCAKSSECHLKGVNLSSTGQMKESKFFPESAVPLHSDFWAA